MRGANALTPRSTASRESTKSRRDRLVKVVRKLMLDMRLKRSWPWSEDQHGSAKEVGGFEQSGNFRAVRGGRDSKSLS
jgi:hypothetical protein